MPRRAPARPSSLILLVKRRDRLHGGSRVLCDAEADGDGVFLTKHRAFRQDNNAIKARSSFISPALAGRDQPVGCARSRAGEPSSVITRCARAAASVSNDALPEEGVADAISSALCRHEILHALRGGLVESGEGLIEQQQFRLDGQSTGQRYTPAPCRGTGAGDRHLRAHKPDLGQPCVRLFRMLGDDEFQVFSRTVRQGRRRGD